MTPPVEMTKGRAALPATVVAEQDPFFITLGGPLAHDFSGRDDNSIAGSNPVTWLLFDSSTELSSRPELRRSVVEGPAVPRHPLKSAPKNAPDSKSFPDQNAV
jgi:hypothetical protein